MTPNGASKVYGQADPGFTGTLSGFLAGDHVTATYGRTLGDTVPGSPYTISATLDPAAVLANYDVQYNTATFTITPRALTVTAHGVNKGYDDLPDATVTLTDNRLSGDNLTASYTSASFVDQHVGTGKAVNVSGISISGPDAANYTVNTTAATTANVAQRAITVTAQTNTKTADGNTSAAAVPQVTTGSIAGNDAAAFTEAYLTPDAGTGKTLVPSGSVADDNGGSNYDVTFVDDTTGVINAASPTKLVFTSQPSSEFVGATMTPSVVLQVTDAFDNPTTATGSVTITLSAGQGTLNGTATKPISATGQAVFDDLNVTDVGTYTLTAVRKVGRPG